MNKERITTAYTFIFDTIGDMSAIKNRRGWDILEIKVEEDEKLHKTVFREVLEEILTALPPAKVGNITEGKGFNLLVRFFQSFMIMGGYGIKK